MEGRAGAWWAAASMAVSAGLYLMDLGTNISALRSLYRYEYLCPHAPLASPLLRTDPICRAIRSGLKLHSIGTEFWECLTVLLVAHVTYPFIFWVSLDPRLHPFRLAYFMPLIHLYRLLKLLFLTLSCNGVEKLQKEQRESNSLYNAVGAALETTPQFIIQFHIAMRLGEYIKGSSDPNMDAQRIPTNLLLSLIVSLASATYNASMAMVLLLEEHMAFAKKACLSIVIGFQTLAKIIVETMLSTSLAQFSNKGFSIPLLIYILSELLIAWAFCGFLLQTLDNNYKGNIGLVKLAHSFGLGLMTFAIGPIYVIIKLKKKASMLAWGVLSHIFVDLIGIVLVFLVLGSMKGRETPCHPLKITNIEAQVNHYLTCHLFLGAIFSSFFIIFSTTIIFFMLNGKDESISSSISLDTWTSIDTECNSITTSQVAFNLCISKNDIHSLKGFKGNRANKESVSSIFQLLLLFVVILHILRNQKSDVNSYDGISTIK